MDDVSAADARRLAQPVGAPHRLTRTAALRREIMGADLAFLMEAHNGLSAQVHEMMEARRKNPQDDLTSDMMIAQAEGAEISDAEIALNLIGLLVAGNLTSTDLIGNGIWLLLTHPKQLAKLRADPSLDATDAKGLLTEMAYDEQLFSLGRVEIRVHNQTGLERLMSALLGRDVREGQQQS